MKSLYFDQATPPNQAALDVLGSFSRDHFQSLGAPYALQGREGRLIEETYDELYRFVCASAKDKLYFVTSKWETLNAIYQALYLDLIAPTGRNHILTTTAHAGALEPFSKAGIVTKLLQPDERGLITPQQVAEAITPRTSLLSLPWADPQSGVIYPIWEIAKMARERGVYVHVEASEILGKLFFRMEDLPIDFLSFEGKAIRAPLGTGALFQKYLTPVSLALPEMPSNPPGFIALGEAVFESRKRSEFAALEMARLRNLFEEKLSEAEVLFGASERLPEVSCLRFSGVHAEALLYYLVEQKVYATYVPDLNALSFALNAEMKEEDILQAVERIQKSYASLKEFSPC